MSDLSEIKGQNTERSDTRKAREMFTFLESWTQEVNSGISLFFCKSAQRGVFFQICCCFTSLLTSSLSVLDNDTKTSQTVVVDLGMAGGSISLF